MKKITDYRKLLGVQKDAELKELKTIYRNLMKDWHPDKFQDSEEAKIEAETKSKEIIEAYHFLVSIAPETIALSMEEYASNGQVYAVSQILTGPAWCWPFISGWQCLWIFWCT